jgi:peptidoglycan/LPS O-acetylase OafA/YrhL
VNERLDNIQVLRAFAAISVVVAHTGYTLGNWHAFGTFGVDIFFVISGFIMALICTNRPDNFIVKRLIRIVPLYWTMTLASFAVLATHSNLDISIHRGPIQLLKSLFFVPYAENDGTIAPILGVGWTLNYEMCFYLILACAILIWKSRRDLAAVCLLLAIMVIAEALPRTAISSFYGRPIMLEFVAGVAVFHIYRAVQVKRAVRLRPVLYGTILVSTGFLMWYEGTQFNQPSGTRLGFGIPAVLLALSVVLLSKSGVSVPCKLPVLVGDASYALYLIHVFVVSAFKHVVDRYAPSMNASGLLGAASVVMISCVLAIGVHLFLDRPMQSFLYRLFILKKRGTAAAAV